MSFWRMQLHPDDPGAAALHSVNVLGKGYIGLDFVNQPGDLTKADLTAIVPAHQRHYAVFADQMQIGDVVMVVVHNRPFALVEVTGSYNYVLDPDELGVWFRHMRRAKLLGMYSDYINNPADWAMTPTAPTIMAVVDTDGDVHRLMEQWHVSLTASQI